MGDEEVVLVGRVAGEGTAAVLAKAELVVGNQRTRQEQDGRFVLEVDGRLVTVELALDLLAEEKEEGRWTEVADTRLGRLFANQAPGDHVKVSLSGVVLVPGDVVAVRGTAVEVAPAAVATGSYREAPPVLVTAVRGVRAARAADEAGARVALEQVEAEARAREARDARAYEERQRKEEEKRAREARKKAEAAARPPRVPPPWQLVTRIFAVIALGLFAAAAWAAAPSGWSGLIPWAPAAAMLWILGIPVLGAAVICWEVRHDLPLVHEVGVGWPARIRPKWLLPVQLTIIPIVLPMTVGGGSSKAEAVPRAAAIIAVSLQVLLMVTTFVRRRSALRRLWLVARSRPVPAAAPEGAWGYVDGIVRAGVPASGPRADRVLGARTTLTWDSGDKEVEIKTHLERAEGFHLETQLGTVEVDVAGAVWAAPAAWRREKNQPVAVGGIRDDDLVRVLGRLRQGPAGLRFQSTGRESLFIVSGSPWRLWWRALAPTLAYAAIVALAVVIAAA